MDLSFLNEFVVVIVLAFCLGIGFIIKYSLDFIDNKYIPLIMGVVGVAFNIFVNSGVVTPVVIVGGLISGLASTGLYEMFRNFISKE
ncbi:MAG: phage holin family protein [Clostridium saudiense]|uniref:phage holin family protein n=1 Tax=Clostridium saudiense TaxID=1414720 RepID=UPI00290D26A8|nr:phage holin family protein [Clostridium saudiense]MDU3520242.1 phage holin family protein [Clostridium saudiense]